MRKLFLAALGVFALASAATAQQPQYQPAPRYPATVPSAAAATPLQPVSGTTVIQGSGGCTNCGTVGPVTRGFKMSSITGGNCQYGAPCQNGCGSVKSDLAFHFGSCKQFFSPCGPTWGHGCGITPIAQPYGTGFGCPRAYDSYANH
ncbi:unnamed protein product [Gemmata massiliana]|uniref:Uncharacterized protein n=1 Tax=Gemmata massiliana TaxID=1210884 RepID=A0A6P2D337_9BACT|nr:hypothetical protein [Gemmata massiliana]VTR95711.1 unnamed protein product [Gemmata massiliana]